MYKIRCKASNRSRGFQLCFQFGTALHEIGHVLGLVHEHNRPDRNYYVSILWENIDLTGANFLNFVAWNWTATKTYSLPYDVGSIMHYGTSVMVQ